MRATTIEGQNAFAPALFFCVNFTWQMVKTRVIRLRVIEGPNARDQSAFYAFLTFLVEFQRNAGYIRRDECVIKTWKLGLWAPLVARNYYFFHFQCWNWLWNGVPQSSISPTTVVDLALWRRHNPPQIILFLKVTIKRTLQKYNLTLTKMTPTKLLTHCPG